MRLNGAAITPDLRREIRDTVALLETSHALGDVREFIQSSQAREALAPFVDGHHTGIFDARDDRIRLSDWTVFETDDLFAAGPDIAVLALDYLFRMVESSLDGRPTLIVIDEAWAFLSTRCSRPGSGAG